MSSSAFLEWIPVGIPAGVFLASLVGSPHCLGMCGGLALSAGKSGWSQAQYHLARLGVYGLLGVLAGKLGEVFFSDSKIQWVSWFGTALLALGFIMMGVQVWRGRPVHFSFIPAFLMRWLGRAGAGSRLRPAFTGIMTGLLPCGWLHTFVLSAVATGSPLKGSSVLFFFWLGTLPSLIFGQALVHEFVRPLARRAPQVSAMILIGIGVASLGVRAYHALPHPVEQTHRCH